jgi:hypothetical protein
MPFEGKSTKRYGAWKKPSGFLLNRRERTGSHAQLPVTSSGFPVHDRGPSYVTWPNALASGPDFALSQVIADRCVQGAVASWNVTVPCKRMVSGSNPLTGSHFRAPDLHVFG